MNLDKLKEIMSSCRDKIEGMYPFCECSAVIYTQRAMEGSNVYDVQLQWNINLPNEFLNCYDPGGISPAMSFTFDIVKAGDMRIVHEVARIFSNFDAMLGNVNDNYERYKKPRVGLV